MTAKTQLNLFGSLRKALEDSHQFPIQLDIRTPTPLEKILRRYQIPMDRVQLVMVNHRAISKNASIYPGDRLALFSKEYAIFADWKDFRF